MKATKDELGSKARTVPHRRFESQKLTSFSGLVGGAGVVRAHWASPASPAGVSHSRTGRVPVTEFSMSVPFERFPGLKERIESRQRWCCADGQTDYCEMEWKPDCWARRRVQLIAVRRRQGKQRKGPLQLDLFEPMDFEYQYTVIATNKTARAAHVIAFHHGRGSQEGVIGELKSAMQFDYIPCRKRLANETYMLAAVFAHNLLRRLQMQQGPVRSNRGWKRPACWVFEKAHSVQLCILHRAGKLTTPGNQLTLTISGDGETEKSFTKLLEQPRPAA